MTELLRALTAFFSGAGMPVYRKGWVPAGARFPYLTLEAEIADWRRVGYLALTVWHRAEADGSLRRMEDLERLAARIPEGGLRLPYPGGMCLVRRARADFLRLIDGPDTAGALGGQVRFDIVRYPRGRV